MGSWEPAIQARRPQSGLTPVRQANQQVWFTKRHQHRYGVANRAEDKSHSVLLGVGVLLSGLPPPQSFSTCPELHSSRGTASRGPPSHP